MVEVAGVALAYVGAAARAERVEVEAPEHCAGAADTTGCEVVREGGETGGGRGVRCLLPDICQG